MSPCKDIPALRVCAVASWLTGAGIARADEQTLSSEALALGGAAVASTYDNSAISVNPGVIALRRRYDFHGHFRLGPEGALQWAASAVDGRTSRHFSMGLAYSGDRWHPDLLPEERPPWVPEGTEPTNVKRVHDLTVALGFPFARRALSVGLNGDLSIYHHDQQGRGTAGNVDLGLGWSPEPWITLGLVGRNLIPVHHEVIDRAAGVGIGTRLGSRTVASFLLDAGWVATDAGVPFTLSTGAEKVFRYVQLRAGWRYLGSEEARRGCACADSDSAVTAGLGLGSLKGSATVSWGIAIPVGTSEPLLPGLTNQFTVVLMMPDEDEL